MVPFPLFKLAALFVRHVSKYGANRIKSQAHDHPEFRRLAARYGQAIHQLNMRLSVALLRNVDAEIRAKEKAEAPTVMFGFFTGGLLFLILPGLLPRAETIMETAERARQSQERLIEFQQQAIERLDSHRTGVSEAIVGLQLHFAHGELPQLLAHEMEGRLSGQATLIISDMEKRNRRIPEEIRRLRRIEDGQREGQGMDNRQLLEMVGRRAQEERDILEARLAAAPSEEDSDICPMCIFL
ncbi:optic atrophy 3 protein-domain-containing protein [Xylaria grammica]|nr:optic atrophy 3 protein-domain-containing protein [Xylaria grammica]